MSKIGRILIGLLLLVMASCNYDTDVSKKIQAVSPDEYVKTVANEFFSSAVFDTLQFQKLNQTIGYMAKSYAAFPNSTTGKPSIYLLIEDIKALIGGNINVLPTLIAGFKNEQGVYKANTDSSKWIKTGNATDSVVMNFKDQYKQNKQAIIAWYYPLGQPLTMKLVRKTGTVVVSIPTKVMLKMSNLSASSDSTMMITTNILPNQTFTQVGISTTATYLDYSLDAQAVVKDTAMHIACTVARAEKQIVKYTLDGNATNLLRGFMNKVDYPIVLGAYNSRLNILDKLYTTNDVKDANTLKDYLLSNTASGTYDYIKGICDLVNKSMYFRVWNSSGSLLCSATMYPVKLNGSYIGAPYINWIYGDSQDLSDFSNAGIKNTVSKLQKILQYLNGLLGKNS